MWLLYLKCILFLFIIPLIHFSSFTHEYEAPIVTKASAPTVYDSLPQGSIWISDMSSDNTPPATEIWIQEGTPQYPLWRLAYISDITPVVEPYVRVSQEEEHELELELAYSNPEIRAKLLEELDITHMKDFPKYLFLMVIHGLKHGRYIQEQQYVEIPPYI